jgi:hypothetical protein
MLFEERIYYARPLKCRCFLWRSKQLKKYMDLYDIMLLWVTPLWKSVVRIRPTIFGLLRGQVAFVALGESALLPLALSAGLLVRLWDEEPSLETAKFFHLQISRFVFFATYKAPDVRGVIIDTIRSGKLSEPGNLAPKIYFVSVHFCRRNFQTFFWCLITNSES